MKTFYSLQEAADKLKVSTETVKTLARERRIAQFGDPDSLRYRKDQIDKLAHQKNGTKPTDKQHFDEVAARHVEPTEPIVASSCGSAAPDINLLVDYPNREARNSKRRALYIGSFDPITNGHLWVIEQGSMLFDELIVGVGVNPKKTYTFTQAEREAIIKKVVAPFGNVKVKALGKKLAAKFARDNGCSYLLQGIRDENDYIAQRAARYGNEDIVEGIQTILVIPPRELVETSSSFVKGLVGFDDWEQVVSRHVPEDVFKLLRDKYASTTQRA